MTTAERLTADEMGTLVAEAATGVRPERSKLAPLSPAQRTFRDRVGREVTEAMRRGLSIDIPAETPG